MAESPEYKAVQKHYTRLIEAVTQGIIPATLFENEVITDDTLEAAGQSSSRTTRDKGAVIMKDVRHAIRLDPQKAFSNFCDALSKEPSVKSVVDEVQATLKKLKEENTCPEVDEEFQKLTDRLDALNSTLDSASNPDVELATINCLKDQIQQYIEKRLRMGVEASQVKNDMDKLCRVDLVIPTPLWTWTLQEVDKADEKLASRCRKNVNLVPRKTEDTSPPSLFSKDTLYHASLCCEAINFSHPGNPLSFFQDKKPQHNLTGVSFSQTRDGITPYLIAKQQDIIYVAFRSISSVSEWTQNAQSFNEGLRQQCSQIPLRFFMDELFNNKRIVLTGFSFGGMLACCVAAKLWYSVTADRDVLLERVICITFGQPFLQIDMVEEEIAICPQFEQSIHSVFIKDDIVPLMFSYLAVEESDLPKVPSPVTVPKMKALVAPSESVPIVSTKPQSKLGGLFSAPFVKVFLQHLAVLQDASSKNMASSVQWLQNTLMGLAASQDQNKCILYGNNCYVVSQNEKKGVIWQHQTKQIAAVELSQRTKRVADQLGQLFQKHKAEVYMPLVFRSHLDKYPVPNQGQARNKVAEVDAVKPKVTALQIQEYPPDETVIILQGENLWFSYNVTIDDKGPCECDFSTSPENTTQCMVEFRSNTFDNSIVKQSKQVKVALYTHFANAIRQPLNTIIKEPHDLTVRQMQLAKHTPSQVIQLAYICALLEQQHQETSSKRYRAIAHFLQEAIKVVPVESIFDAIAYGSDKIALKCAKALMERKPQLQPSEMMIKGALRASMRAHTGHNGSVIDRFYIPSVKSMQQVFRAVFWWLQTVQRQGYQQPSQPIIATGVLVQSPVQPYPRVATQVKTHSHTSVASSRSPSQLASKKLPQSKKNSQAIGTRKSSNAASQQRRLQPQVPVMAVPFTFPVFLNPSQVPTPSSFPPYIMKFLDQCLKELIEDKPRFDYMEPEMDVVSKANISEVYGSTRKPLSHFKSPLKVLSEGRKSIASFIEADDTSHKSATSKLPNELMLELIRDIYHQDVALCATLLGAFMEQQIHIPLIYTPKNTAETLSSKAAPVAVGVWALFSQNLSTLKAKLESGHHNELIVEIREYIKGISQQLPENEDRMYAGKLQFLLQGMQEIVTARSQYISYSLERQLYSMDKFNKSITLRKLLLQWDKIFENDALSLIGQSHRPLVARWLKWTILVHDLREELARHTCIGVTGLVKSGKSLLVRDLFKIEKVKVGTRSAKRTTVPLLYSLEDCIEGLDVIDFPGVDDKKHSIPEMADLLLSLAQIVVFVVDFKRVTSDVVKEWLQALTRNGAPVHVCLTHADELYLECAKEGKLDGIAQELQRIRKHLQLDAQRTKDVTFYSFNHASSDVSTEDLKQCGIRSSLDVGHWLVEILKTTFKQSELAEKLKEFIQRD